MITHSSISFLLGFEPVTVEFGTGCSYSPTTTVLSYLRSMYQYRGTKESCGQGQCGVCTVVLAWPDISGRLKYEAFSSCLLFLSMLHGKQLITIRTLGESGDLHPVQLALAAHHKSNCGFCTPGVAMSLFAMYKNLSNPSKDEISSHLTGHLCSCSGYMPLLEAAGQVLKFPEPDIFTERETSVIKMIREIDHSRQMQVIETGYQKYFIPVMLREALQLKSEYPTAVIVSGATELAVQCRNNHEEIQEIIDISGVGDLKHFDLNVSGLLIGAGLPLNQAALVCRESHPALHNMLMKSGSFQVRNAATLGGNIAAASPVSDILPVLMACDCTVVTENLMRQKKQKLTDFIRSKHRTFIHPDEIITNILVPRLPAGVEVRAYKISARQDADVAIVNAGFRLDRLANGMINDIRLFYGGMAGIVSRASNTEQFLTGKTWNRENVQEAMKLIRTDFTPESDALADAGTRLIMTANLLLKFWLDTLPVQVT